MFRQPAYQPCVFKVTMKNHLPFLIGILLTCTLCWPAQAKGFPQKWHQGQIQRKNEP
ncbi:hypothetical protein BH24BAC1_BH24BAC1_38780 [soil metagenome]